MASSSARVETRAPVAALSSTAVEGGVDVPRRNGAGGVTTISGGLKLELLPPVLGTWIGPI